MYKFLMALLALSAVGVSADTTDRSWVFDTSGDAQGWVQTNFSPSGVDGGAWFGTSTATVAHLTGPGNLSVAASTKHYVEVRMRLSTSTGGYFGLSNGAIQFTTAAEPSFSDDKRVRIKTFGNNQWRTYRIRMGNSAKWTGTIANIRVQPGSRSGMKAEIAYIKLLQDDTPPSFKLETNWTLKDGETTNDTTPTMIVKDQYDLVSGLLKAEFFRRPAGATTEESWVLMHTDNTPADGFVYRYSTLPAGSYDFGAKVYDRAGNVSSWTAGDECWIDDVTVQPSLATRIDVDTAQVREPLLKDIGGNNVLWNAWSNKYNPATGDLTPYVSGRIDQMGMPGLRYPGGCFADTFYWKKSIGPVASRPSQVTNPCAPFTGSGGPAKFGLDEWLRWCELKGIEPIFTCRFRWEGALGAPGLDGPNPFAEALADAVDLVEYCNAPNNGSNPNGGTDWAAVRAANGRQQPYNLKLIEVANEPYKPDPWGSPGNVGLEGASEYTYAFLRYMEAMKAVDPSITVLASAYLEDQPYEFDIGSPRWSYSTYAMLSPFVDEAQYHIYRPYSGPNYDIDRLYWQTMAVPRGMDDALSLQRTSQKMANPERQDPIKLWLSEWGVVYTFFDDPSTGNINYHHVGTLKAALALLDSLRVLQENSDITTGAHTWYTYGSSPFGFIRDNDSSVSPSFYAYRIFNRHSGDDVVAANVIGSPTFDYDKYPDMPVLTALATRSTDGQSLYLTIINKEKTIDRTATVNLANFAAGGQRLDAEVWELNGPDVDDYQHPDDVKMLENVAVYDSSFTYTFPAHSATSFKFTPTAPGDTTPPTVTIGAPSTMAASSGAISFPIQYSGAYAVTLSAADVILTKTGTANASVTVTGSGNLSRLITLGNLSGDGTIAISIAAGSANDGSGNSAPAAGPSPAVVVDTTGPVTAIGAPSTGLTRTGPVTYSVTYTGATAITLAPSQVIVHATGTAAATVGVSGTGSASRTVTLSGITGDGTLAISIPAGTATDALANPSYAAGPSAAFTTDNTPPAVSNITGPSVSQTKSGPVSWQVSFSEPVTGFNASSDVLVNATDTAASGSTVVTGSGAGPYTVTLSSITGNGSLGITVKAAAASDAAGNPSTALTSGSSVSVDNTAPVISIGQPSADVTRGNPVSYTVSYSGASSVTLTPEQVTLNKAGSANGVVQVTGEGTASRTVIIADITGAGTLGISIAAGSATDAVGNLAPAAGPSATFTVENEPLGIQLSSPSVQSTISGPVTYTVSYTGAEAVTLSTQDILLDITGSANANVAVSGTGLKNRTITLTNITGTGTLGVSIGPGTASGQGGALALSAGPSATFTVGGSGTAIAIGAANPAVTDGSGTVSFPVTYTNATAVTLAPANITVNKTGTANASDVQVTGSGSASRTVTLGGISGNGTLGISIASGTATGAGGPAPAAGPSAVSVVDTLAPGILIGAPSASVSSGAPVSYTVTYVGAESVSLSAAQVTLNKTGTANGFVNILGSGVSQRIVQVAGVTGNGTLGISIAAGTASDVAGHTAPAAGPSQTFSVDTSAPSVAIGAPSKTMTGGGADFVEYTIAYSGADQVSLDPGNITLNKTGTANGTVVVTGSGLVERKVRLADMTGNGTLGISIAAGTASDNAGNSAAAAGPSQTVLVDTAHPSAVTVTDQGAWTPSIYALSATWTASSDAGGSGIARYEYAIGTGPNVQDVRGWTSTGLNTSVEDNSLVLDEGTTYYIQVRAVDKVGLTSQPASSDGITVAPDAGTIGASFAYADGEGLSLLEKIVTSSGQGAFWLQEPEISAAVKVISGASVAPGDLVSVAGVYRLTGARRELAADVIVQEGQAAVPAPINSIIRSVGGGDFNEQTPGKTGGVGLYNVGMYVRLTGSVTYSDNSSPSNRFFYIYDGSPPTDSSGHDGILVRTGANSAPASGMYVVTGIIDLEMSGSDRVPVVLAYGSGDVIPAENVPPVVRISSPSVRFTSTGPVTYSLAYSGAASISLSPSDIMLVKTGTANASVALTGSGSNRTVTLSSITGAGTLAIQVAAGTAQNSVGIPAAGAGPSVAVNIDATPPTQAVVTDEGAWTSSGTTLSASWTSADPESGIEVYHYAIGTTPTDPGAGYVRGWTPAWASAEADGLNLTSGVTYYWYVKAQNRAGLMSAVGVSDGVTVDTTPPASLQVTDDGAWTSSISDLHASWSASDPQSGIVDYEYSIGTNPAGPDENYLITFTSSSGSSEAYVDGLTLQHMQSYYWYLRAKNQAGLLSTVAVSDGIRVDATPPSIAVVTDSGTTTLNNTQLQASWSATDAESGIGEYLYAIGTTPTNPGSGYTVPWKSAGTQTSIIETGLSLIPGQTYYWYVMARNSGGALGPVGASAGIFVESPLPTTPVVTDPGQFHTNMTQMSFSWVSPPGGSQPVEYQYALGTSPTPPSGFNTIFPSWCTIGASITFSLPNPNVSWAGSWGINASARSLDYLHLIESRLKAANPANSVEFNGSLTGPGQVAGGTGGTLDRALYQLPTYKGYNASLYVIQLGENDIGITVSQFRTRYAQILDGLLTNNPRPMIFCYGVWNSRSNYSLATKEAQFEQVIQELCDQRNLRFGSVKYVATNPANNLGTTLVKWHPNDNGHRQYADLFWQAFGGYALDWTSAGAATAASVSNLSLVDGTTYYWYVRAKSASGQWSTVGVSDGILVDSSAPITPAVTDDGTNQADKTFLHATWTSSENVSQIVEYQYAVGLLPWDSGSNYVVPWTSTGLTSEITKTGLSLVSGKTYYFYVRARNDRGLWSPVGISNGIKID